MGGNGGGALAPPAPVAAFVQPDDSSEQTVITPAYNSDGTLASITETVYSSPGVVDETTVWTYGADQVVTQITLNSSYEGSTTDVWDYTADGTPTSITEQSSFDGSGYSDAWTYTDGVLSSVVTTDNTANGFGTTMQWDYNADGSPAQIVQTTTNSASGAGSTPSGTTTWVYDGGLLNSVTQQITNGGGTSTAYAWDNNADGSLVVYQWSYNASGSPTSLYEQVTNAAGILVNSYSWQFGTGGTVTGYRNRLHHRRLTGLQRGVRILLDTASSPRHSAEQQPEPEYDRDIVRDHLE